MVLGGFKLIFKNSALICFILISNIAFSQLTQTLNGNVIDEQSRTPIAGVIIKYVDSNVNLQTTSDSLGNFSLENIPVGRQYIMFSAPSYKDQTIQLLFTSGKQVYVQQALRQDIKMMEELKILSKKSNKAKQINSFSTVSARMFSVEEVNRFAGTLNDPSRMAANFAGVASAGDSRNDIIIRGNSPTGLLWRIDGVDVANPNHFGSKGTSGGPITILNNNLLANSDFFMGAFPASYGNAFSGVFDVNIRNGNFKKHEFAFQVGMNGLEANLEGPIDKKNKSSYLLAYRYSFLKLLLDIGYRIGTQGIPEYQDLTAKFNFPTKKLGTFSYVAILGQSNINNPRGKINIDPNEALWNARNENNKTIQYITNKINFGNQVQITSYVFFSTDKYKMILDSPRVNQSNKVNADFNDLDYVWGSGINYRIKLNVKNTFETGVRFTQTGVDYVDSALKTNIDKYVTVTDIRKNINQLQGYLQWKHDFNDNFFIQSGVHTNSVFFNNTFSIEPRIGASYTVGSHVIGYGYGLVAKPLSPVIYFKEVFNNITGETLGFSSNYNLEFLKSHQHAISDNWIISKNFRIKTEVYYQDLYNLPIQKSSGYYNQINDGMAFFQQRLDSLVSQGKGRNYGIELTLEKFFVNNWYALITSSIFKSEYQGSDQIWRNSAYDKQYILNFLCGYEWNFNNKHAFQIDLKATMAGGAPLEAYDANGKIDQQKVYTERSKDYSRIDIQFVFRKNSAKFSQNIKLSFQNIFDTKNEYLRFYNEATRTSQITYQMGFLGLLFYQIQF